MMIKIIFIVILFTNFGSTCDFEGFETCEDTEDCEEGFWCDDNNCCVEQDWTVTLMTEIPVNMIMKSLETSALGKSQHTSSRVLVRGKHNKKSVRTTLKCKDVHKI